MPSLLMSSSYSPIAKRSPCHSLASVLSSLTCTLLSGYKGTCKASAGHSCPDYCDGT